MLGVSFSRLYLDVERTGFHLFNVIEDVPLDSLAAQLGHPVASALGRPQTDVLVPRHQSDSHPKTLSYIYGTDAFPFHTETAHWRNPVDWVILRCIHPGAGNRVTHLIDGWDLGLDGDEARLLAQSLMVVKSGSKSFLAPPVEKENGRLLFRYDPNCTYPASNRDISALDILRRRLNVATQADIVWKPGRYLIFDNRRMFHSRGIASASDTDRRLERIYIVKR